MNELYWVRVREYATALKSDGCTKAMEWYRDC